MSRPSLYPNRKVLPPQLLSAFLQTIEPYVPLALKGTRLTATDVWYVLGYASLHQTSLETACNTLAEAPSGNRLREVLGPALPPPAELQRQLNTALLRQLPRRLRRGRWRFTLALDCTLLPYHGRTDEHDPIVLRAKAKAGTHHFHGYATVSIVHDGRRYILALRLVRPGETMAQIVDDLLDRVQHLGLPVRRVYLDKEFYSVAVFRTLERRHLSYVMALPMHPPLKERCHGQRSFYTTYTLQSHEQGSLTLQVALVYRHRRSPQQKRVVHWFAFAVAGLPSRMAPRQVFEVYRHRFGIETSYRQMNQVRARTSSRSAVLRLLFVGIALLLVNLFVTLRRGLGTPVRSGTGGAHKPFRLALLAKLLSHALEALLGIRLIEQFRKVYGFS